MANDVAAPQRPALRDERSAHFRADIQGLRALAVVLVVAAHASVPGLGGGYIGVDVFFVISGYVITGVLMRQRGSTVRGNLALFYSRRIRRIIPAATVVLVATVIGAHVWLTRDTTIPLVTDVRWASLFAANWHLIATGSSYFIPGVPPSLVTHYWSLSVEEQFYVVFPLIVFCVGAVAARRRPLVLGGVLVGAVALSSWWSVHLTSANSVAAYYSPFTRFWELALGGLLVLAPAAWSRRTPRANALAGWAAVIVIVISADRLSTSSAYPGALAWWPCAAAAVLLWTGASSASWGPVSALSWRPVTYVGDVSYGFYLWHYAWLQIPAQRTFLPVSAGARVGEVAGAFGCAVLSYHLMERPIRRSAWLDRRGWAVALLLVGCLGLTWGVTALYAHG